MSNTIKFCCLAAAMLSCAISAQEQEQRWFEVEMIVFSQTPATALQEQFDTVVTPVKPGRAIDLLTSRYQPPLKNLLAELPLCPVPQQFSIEYAVPQLAANLLCIFEPQPDAWQQRNLFEPRLTISTVPYPQQTAVVISGDAVHQSVPYLAEAEALQLGDIAAKIQRQPGNKLLLHTSWRQAPVTERRAIASRWFAGQNLSAQFDYWGQPRHPADVLNAGITAAEPAGSDNPATANELLTNIEQLLQQLTANNQLPEQPVAPLDIVTNNSLALASLPDQVWQLDGLFKLHLDHYLFVNTEFNLRLAQQDKLQTVYVRQSRRVISGEIHYLDHPYLGIVLQIRRFEPPQAEDIEANLLTE
ncbi:CsiV family protein [Rheinheimera sp.]|uniref:CsiV family protein n=1 Tax=Rheinheimera sp. TaxID=1869214 RepID=UPI002732420D|nr:CsiV family protein [Rheinheimera sp.]MDP2713655.1 CsiV family protein [Rheinheimera sp.]